MVNAFVNRHQRHLEKYRRIELVLVRQEDDKGSSISRQHEKLAKAHATFIILQSQNQNKLAYALAKDLCKTAKKYRMPKFVIDPSAFLYRYYAQFQFDRPKALKMKRLNQWAIEAYTIEIENRNRLTNIILSDRSKHSKKHTPQIIDQAWLDIQKLFERCDTFEFRKEAYLIGINYCRQHDHWGKMEVMALDALHFFKTYPLVSEPIMAIYYRHLINAMIAQNRGMDVDIYLSEYEQVAQKSKAQWINYLYTIARLRVSQLRYSEVKELIQKARKSKSYVHISGVNKLAWEIIEGYVVYATRRKQSKAGKLSLSNSLTAAREEDMLSDQYSIQLIILRLIHYTYNKEWQLVDSNSSAISKYLSRKLTRSGERRSFYFINMLLQISKQRYHPVAVKRHAHRYYTKLVAAPANAVGSQDSYEIIPYEKLWEDILENLKK